MGQGNAQYCIGAKVTDTNWEEIMLRKRINGVRHDFRERQRIAHDRKITRRNIMATKKNTSSKKTTVAKKATTKKTTSKKSN